MSPLFRAQWRTAAAHAAGEHHSDHDTEAAADAAAVAALADGARGAVVYQLGEGG